MKRPIQHLYIAQLVSVSLLAIVMLFLCGLTAFAAEEGSPDLVQTDPPAAVATTQPPDTEEKAAELYPADVQTVISNSGRQILKTYILTPQENPADIIREGFTRDGWRYTLTDITEKRTIGSDAKVYIETVEINTETKDLAEILKLLAPALEHQSEDGYAGVLTLDLSTVKCEEAGTKTNSYTISATREYPHLSNQDLSLIPKTITDNGRTLNLDGVSWVPHRTVNVDYVDVPESYNAIAKYTGSASQTVVTGYVTTAAYAGEITKTFIGDTIYTAYFEGTEINPTPKPTPTPVPTITPEPIGVPSPTEKDSSSIPLVPILIGFAVLVAISGAGAYFYMRRNVKIYRDNFRVLVAKDKINAKNSVIDLSPLEGDCFGVEIDKYTAKVMNGVTVEVKSISVSLKHKIAYEGNAYRIEADFGRKTIQAIH